MRTCHVLLSKCVALLLALMFAGPAVAAYSQIIAFGDSLSDTGNLYRLTSAMLGFGVPGQPYVDGRFSNGLLAVEQMAIDMNLDLTSHAVGGAQTGVGNQGGALLTGTGVAGQIASFVDEQKGQSIDAQALYFLWAGPNDFLSGGNMWLAPTSQEAAGNMLNNVKTLFNQGARHFFIPLMPDLSQTPTSLGNPEDYQYAALQRTYEYNYLLNDELQQLFRWHPDLSLTVFDTTDFMWRQLNGLHAQGANTVDACYNASTGAVCKAPDAYLFWDGQHPTAAANIMLGHAFAAAAVPEPSRLHVLLIGLAVMWWHFRRRERFSTDPAWA